MTRKMQLMNVLNEAVEQRLSERFYNVLLAQVDKKIAEMLRIQYKRGLITRWEFQDRSILAAYNLLQKIA